MLFTKGNLKYGRNSGKRRHIRHGPTCSAMLRVVPQISVLIFGIVFSLSCLLSVARLPGLQGNRQLGLNGLEVCDQDCLSRLHEFQSKLDVEKKITREILMKEYYRNFEDPYLRKDPRKRRETLQGFLVESLRPLEYSRSEDDPFARPSDQWSHGESFPDISIIGFVKTGTSQLYKIFETHRDMLFPSDDWKEHCTIDHDYPSLYRWHEFYYQKRRTGRKTMNGCMAGMIELEPRWYFNPPNKNDAKIFIIYRDPAEWMWAAFNFFTDDNWEDRPEENGWTNETVHYRSPELFRELMLSAHKEKELKPGHYLFELREDSVWETRRAIRMAGAENVVLLKNEDLVPDRIESSGLLNKLSSTTGLALDGFDMNVMQSKTNCNSKKSLEGESCGGNVRSANGGGYPITHNRPMLEATRKLIYTLWREECTIWAEEFGIVYPECIEAF